MRKVYIMLIAVAMAMIVVSMPTASAYDIILTLDADTYEIGDTVTASVVWTGLTSPPGLYVWLMDIEYDESILQYNGEEGITWGPDWANSYPVPGGAGNLALTGSNGKYGGVYGDPNDLISAIEFTAIGTGDITVTMIHHDDSGMNNMLADYTMIDAEMEFFGDTATVTGGTVTPPDPPAINDVISPTNQSTQTITGTMESGSTVHLKVNGSAEMPATPTSGTEWSYIVILSEGTNTIDVFARNSGGDSSTVSIEIVLDTVAPQVAPDLEPGAYDGARTVALTAKDNVTVMSSDGKIYAELTTDDPGASPAMPEDAYTGPIELAEGDGEVRYWLVYGAEDEAGNTSDPAVAAYTIEGTGVAAAAQFDPVPNTVDGRYYDNETLTVTLTTEAGNDIYYEWGAVVSDETEVADPTTSSPAFDAASPITLEAAADTETHYVVKYFAYNAALDKGQSIQILDIYVDTVAPTVPEEHRVPACNATGQSPTQSIFATLTDAGAGIDADSVVMTVQVNGTNLNPDTYTVDLDDTDPHAVEASLGLKNGESYPEGATVSWQISAEDFSGNSLTPTGCAFTIFSEGDITPPTLGNPSPACGATDQALDQSITVTVTDNDSGVDSATVGITATVNGAPLEPETHTVTVDDTDPKAVVVTLTLNAGHTFPEEATITWSVTAGDQAGNELNANSCTFTTIGGGTADPRIDTPPSVMVVGDKYTVSATGGTRPYAWTVERPDTSLQADNVPGDSYTFTAPSTTGNYTITVRDAADASDTAVIQVVAAAVIIDAPQTPPVVSPGSTLKAFEATGGSGNYQWIVTAPDGIDAAPVSGDSFSFTAPDTGTFAGLYTITLSDTQYAGSTASFKVYVPMQVTPRFASVGDNDTWTVQVLGAPQGILPTATVHDMSGADMTGRSGYGALDAGSETGKGIVRYTYTPDDVDTVMAFTLAFTLADWEATPIASVSTDPCWVMPLIDLSGQVVMADGVTPVENASVTPLSGDLAATVTDTNGNFTVSGLADTGSNYRFFIEADGYIGKIVDHTRLLNDSLVTLDAVEGGDAIISGIVSFRYDPGYTQETMALVRIQKADGSWVTDGSGNVMEVFTDRVDGTYAIVVPEADMGNTVTLVVEAEGYLTSSVGSIDVSSGTATVNVQLNAATRIFIDSQPVDVEPADGTYDQVQVSVSAKAGLIDDAFDGIKGEIAISDADGNAVPDPDYESGTRTYTYTHAMYEAFGLTVRADASDLLRDVDTGYVAATAWYYVPSATNAEEIIIGDTALGGSLESISGNTLVRLAPGGIYGNAGRSVILSIVEADADQAGTAGYSGSGLSVIELLNIDGTPLPNEEIDEILITMAFDGSITEDQLRTDAAYTIYYADTLADLVAGNYSGSIPVDRIVGVTYDQNGGWVTFRTNHLTAFGLFSTSEDLTVSEDEGGRSCFIGVTGQPDRVPLWMLSLMGLLAVAWVRYSNGIS